MGLGFPEPELTNRGAVALLKFEGYCANSTVGALLERLDHKLHDFTALGTGAPRHVVADFSGLELHQVSSAVTAAVRGWQAAQKSGVGLSVVMASELLRDQAEKMTPSGRGPRYYASSTDAFEALSGG